MFPVRGWWCWRCWRDWLQCKGLRALVKVTRSIGNRGLIHAHAHHAHFSYQFDPYLLVPIPGTYHRILWYDLDSKCQVTSIRSPNPVPLRGRHRSLSQIWGTFSLRGTHTLIYQTDVRNLRASKDYMDCSTFISVSYQLNSITLELCTCTNTLQEWVLHIYHFSLTTPHSRRWRVTWQEILVSINHVRVAIQICQGVTTVAAGQGVKSTTCQI